METRPDLAAGQAFGRKVTQEEPKKYIVQLDTQSPFFKKAMAFYHKTMAERQVSKPETQTEPLLKQPTHSKSPLPPPEVKTAPHSQMKSWQPTTLSANREQYPVKLMKRRQILSKTRFLKPIISS